MNASPHIAASTKRILLVDDDAGLRSLLQMLLQIEGFSVETAADGVAGFEMFNSAPWDVIITDQMMPRMTGEALAFKIKSRLPKTAVILISGLANSLQPSKLFDAILAKPFSGAELLDCISSIPALKADRSGAHG